jgi:hypothetical protein
MDKLCSKCHAKPVRSPGQRYCQLCHAAYCRSWRKESQKRLLSRVKVRTRDSIAALLSAVGKEDSADIVRAFQVD